MIHIERTPGLSPGAFVSITDEIKSFIKRNHCDTRSLLKFGEVVESTEFQLCNNIPDFHDEINVS